MISAHRISDTTPSTASGVTTPDGPLAATTASRSAYSGLVPMSP